MTKALLVFIFLGMSACVSAPQVMRISNTSFPEATLSKSAQEVKSLLISTLTSGGAILDSSSENSLVFRIKDPNAAMRKMFFGCGFCEDPYASVTFAIAPMGDKTNVVAQYWYVVPQQNGSQNRMPSESNEDYNGIQEVLWRLSDSDPRTDISKKPN